MTNTNNLFKSREEKILSYEVAAVFIGLKTNINSKDAINIKRVDDKIFIG